MSFARCTIVGGKAAPTEASWRDFSPRDCRVDAIHALLRLTLPLLRPHRYDLFMRRPSFITVPRRQAMFLRDRSWQAESARAEAAE